MSQQNLEIVHRLHESFVERNMETPFSAYDRDIEWDTSRTRVIGRTIPRRA